jgi:hypothetical protein
MQGLTSDLNNAQDNKEFFKMAQEALEDNTLKNMKRRASSPSNQSQSEWDFSLKKKSSVDSDEFTKKSTFFVLNDDMKQINDEFLELGLLSS